jgi:pimeloyl-ACP methyl ester carboxylesterase
MGGRRSAGILLQPGAIAPRVALRWPGVTPLSHRVLANGLVHHVLEWPCESATTTVLLLHGFMDAAGTWDLVAPALTQAGLRVLAPDLRGFGEGPRVPAGASYHFPDYVFDVADLVEVLLPAGAPLVVAGHSMGGTAATLYAGAFPERVTRLVVVEGAGPPDGSHAEGPDRLRHWIVQSRAIRPSADARARQSERPLASPEEALRRLVGRHPRVPVEVLRTRVGALARALPDGSLVWRADPLHRTPSPFPFLAGSIKAFARRVTCPVLFVSGGPLGWHPADEEDRIACFASLERVDLPDAGHMMHWTRPAELARAIAVFALAAPGGLTGAPGAMLNAPPHR